MRRSIPLVAGVLVFAGFHLPSRADVPRTVPFQAQVKVSGDKPITTPTAFTFSIYQAATGGTALWNQSETLTPAGGVVATVLGSVTPLTVSFDQPLWVGVAIGTDPEMTPRLPLASVPYALAVPDASVTDAKIASVSWSKLTGVPAGFAPSGAAGGDLSGAYPNPAIGADRVDSTKLANDAASLLEVSGGALASSGGKIGIGVSTPGFPLNFAPVLGDKISLWGNSGATYGFGVQSGMLQIHADVANSDIVFGYGQSSAMTERMRIKGTGNVGIGTTAPASKLSVAGLIQSTTGGFKFPDNTVQTTATPASLPPSGPAGGDLSGTYPSPVIGAGKVTDDKIASVAWSKVTGAPSGLPPGGPAGGDLAGTYPDPTIGLGKVATDRIADLAVTDAKIADLAVTDAKIAGMAYGKLAGAPTSLPPSGPAGGDLTGTYPNPTIAPGTVGNAELASDAASLSKVSEGAMTASSGKVGIGITTPGFPLNFANAVGDKISLWGSTGDNFGFGIQSNLLQIHTAANNADIAFGYGQSSAMTETVRFKASGSVGIGTTYPSHKLTVNGPIRSMTGGFYFPDGTSQVTAGMVAGTTAGGDLTGTYPNPAIKADVVDNTNLVSDAASLNKVTGGAIIVSSGKIGIGTTTPTAKLAVAGDLQADAGAVIGRSGPARGPLDIYGPTGIVDQQQTSADASAYPVLGFWQSFTPSASGSLAGVAAYLGTAGSVTPWQGTLKILAGEGPSGTLLYSQPIWGEGENTPQIIELTSPVQLTGAQVYTMYFTSMSPGMIERYQYGNLYAGGRCNASVDADLWFRTYMLTSEAESAIHVQPMTLNVGIGTTDPKYTLSIVGRMSIDDLPIGDRRAVQWDPDNGLFYRLTSSRRYKENIKPLVDDFERLLQAEPKAYTYIGSPDRQEIGYIAEDLDALGLKSLVEYDKQGRPDALRYEQMALYLVEIAKAQKAEIAALKARNADFEARLSHLEEASAGGTPRRR